MWRKFCLHRGNWCCRIVVGLLICFGLAILAKTNRCVDMNYHSTAWAAGALPNQNIRAEQQEAEFERLAREDPIALLKLALQNYQTSVIDYTCTFSKQERVDGKIASDKMRICFKESPFSVLMNWDQPKGRVDKLLYVEKDGNTDILARPTGIAGMLVPTVRKDVHSEAVKKGNLRTPDQFGIGRSLADMLSVYEEAARKGDLVTDYLGVLQVNDRDCLVLLRELPEGKGYPYAELRVYLDKGYLLPTKVESFDATGRPIGSYTFSDLRFNLGLSDELFSPEANGLDG